ncbi:hypothetical protein CCO02nite_08000 [Cellulomonas composti]|uniref:Uncharacterized protein n=1 Tax=Cellulomonas composti TaxID=266130 RepID=A0A511J818_9CELL|nr:hypothetical protein CCO02nite_08000 [Cellulomonas composti]
MSVITGSRELPVAVRCGEVSLSEAVTAVDDAEQRLLALHDSVHVPAHPDTEWVDDWLHRAHLSYWAAVGIGSAP